MTDAPIVPPNNSGSELHSELRTEFRNWCEAWKTCLQNVLSQVSGQPIVFEISSEPLAAADADVWYTVVAGGAVHGEMMLRLPAASGARLARKFLGETEPTAGAVTPEGITAEQKEALEELLRQIAGLAATALAPSVGGEVQLHLPPQQRLPGLRTPSSASKPATKLAPPSPLKFRSAPPSLRNFSQEFSRKLSPRPFHKHPQRHPLRSPATADLWTLGSMSNSASEPAACCCAMCLPSAPES